MARTSRPALDRSRAAVLEALAQLLVERPEASLGDLAGLVGIGRTTLHRMFPTRQALLRAVALDAADRLDALDQATGLHLAFTPDVSPEASWASLERYIAGVVPLGPRLTFLLRSRELDQDAEVAARVGDSDQGFHAVIGRAQAAGALDPGLPVAWIAEVLDALIYTAWQQVGAGRLASLDAPKRVIRTWLSGVGPGPRT